LGWYDRGIVDADHRNNNARIDTPVFKVDNAFQGRQARKKRDALLAACDYLVFENYRLADKTAWKAYRQALRDAPGQKPLPGTITWPVALS